MKINCNLLCYYKESVLFFLTFMRVTQSINELFVDGTIALQHLIRCVKHIFCFIINEKSITSVIMGSPQYVSSISKYYNDWWEKEKKIMKIKIN